MQRRRAADEPPPPSNVATNHEEPGSRGYEENLQCFQNPGGKNLRRIYVGQLPPEAQDDALVKYFNDLMKKINGCCAAGDPVTGALINKEKKYCFLDFRCAEEASNAMALQGVPYPVRPKP